MTRIVAAYDQRHLPAFHAPGELLLDRCSPNTAAYASFYARHYTRSKGLIGRQLHYLVWCDAHVIGIIASGEPMFRNRARDRKLGITYDSPKSSPPRWLIACAAFRIEDAPYGVAARVINLWRAATVRDMRSEYSDEVTAFETQVGPGLSGACFRHDGWKRCGYTTGRGARRGKGHGHTVREWRDTTRNMVLVRWAR